MIENVIVSKCTVERSNAIFYFENKFTKNIKKRKNVSVRKSRFMYNKVTLSTPNQMIRGGGVFYMYETDSLFADDVFLNNTLTYGNGATITAECDSQSLLSCLNFLTQNLFEGNTASGTGGAIFSSLYGPFTLNNMMIKNRALRGGDNIGSYPYMLGFLNKTSTSGVLVQK